MGYFVFLAFEDHIDGDIVLEHVVGSVEVIFKVFDLFHLSAEIT